MKPLPCLLLLAFSLATSRTSIAGVRPNIVIILIDDLGYADIGPFGAKKQKTPNLDRMAREGMKLTSFYAAPLCSVSRAQLMTGCYGPRVSVPNVYPPASRHGLNPSEYTIAERLKEQGYLTECIGKWHLGDQPEFLPTNQGFDHYLGIPYSNDMAKPAKANGEKVLPLLRDRQVGQLVTDGMQSQLAKEYTDEAVKFIQSAKDRPFFLYLAHTAVHVPVHPGAEFAGKSNNGRFGDMVEEVDWSVGRVLDTLRELKLDDHTLVVFTSDNGPSLIHGADAGSAFPLRGGKGTTWEGGVRVPALAWWPGKIAAGSVSDAISGAIDLLPTCVNIAGGTVPSVPVIDGRDISPILLGKSKESERKVQYYFSNYQLQAVREGPWKLALAAQREVKGRDPAEDALEVPRLYNLEADVSEKTNVAAKHPEIVTKLQALAARMSAEVGGKRAAARRPAGESSNPRMLYSAAEDSDDSAEDGKAQAGPAVPLGTLKPGDTLGPEKAPQIAGAGFVISCTIDTPSRDAIIVAQGGVAAGYALHLSGGHLAFVVRSGASDEFTVIQSPQVVSGKSRIVASLGKDRSMSLSINDQIVATGKAPKLIKRQPAEDFCVGHDNGRPVAAYTAKGVFQGAISGLQISPANP